MTMEENEMLRRLEAVFSDVLEEDVTLEPTTTADDVDGWDSVTNVELVVAIEQAFDVRFNSGEIARLDDVGQLVERLLHSAAT